MASLTNPWVLFAVVMGVLAIAFVIYGRMLPDKWEIREEISFAADQEELYDYLFTIRNWEEWTIWNRESNQKFVFSYEGPEQGKGATQHWKAKNRHGKTSICAGEHPSKIEYMFSFGAGHHSMRGLLEIVPSGNEVKVIWKACGDAGDSPSRRIMAKMFKPYMAKDFQLGLARLKRIFEQEKA